jgi:DNA repair protein RecO (recombination protein O)
MPVVEAEGIVLRQYPFGEADRIVVLLTRELGQVRGVARGVRKPSSRMAASLEPLCHLKFEFYQREGADLCRLRRAELLRSFLGRNPTLDRVYGFSYFAELAQEMVPENSPNPHFFRLMLSTLSTGDGAGVDAALVRYFELWALKLSGLLPNFDYCPSCGACVTSSGFYALIEAGQGLCDKCSGGRGLHIGPEAAGLILKAMKLPPDAFVGCGWDAEPVRGAGRLTERVLSLHLQKRLRSLEPLKEILRGGW